MAFKIKDVLIVDATVIIGLLILLTFQSISSTFIETEASDFMREWHHAETQYNTTIGLLIGCEILNDDRAAYEYLEGIRYDNSIGVYLAHQEAERPVPNYEFVLSEELENKLKENCVELFQEWMEQTTYLAELNRWGYDFGYLQQYDDDGNVYNITHRPFEPGKWTEESGYLYSIVSGPFYVNVTNLAMIMPFVFSAGFASFNVLYARWKGQDEETNMASKWSVGLMGFGFIVLFIGLIVILTGFYEVYMPFIEQGGEYAWKTSDCTNVAPEFITPDMNCEVLELEKELPFDETRGGPEP